MSGQEGLLASSPFKVSEASRDGLERAPAPRARLSHSGLLSRAALT